MCGIRLTLGREVKYLVLILESKVSWRANLAARALKTTTVVVDQAEPDGVFTFFKDHALDLRYGHRTQPLVRYCFLIDGFEQTTQRQT